MRRDDQSLIAGTVLEKRYEHRYRLWCDGPYGGSVAFDKLMEREVGLYVAYGYSDIDDFVRRAKARGRLRHPHLLPVLEFGTMGDNAPPYFTEPWVETVALEHILRNVKEPNSLLITQLVKSITGVCGAVSYAHEKGLCHLDLCPENVQSDFALVDYFVTGGWEENIATLPESHDCLRGILAFAAPEQLQYPSQKVLQLGLGCLADVYGLGAIMYSLLYDCPPNLPKASRLPSPEESIKAILARKGPPSPGQLRPILKASTPKSVQVLERIALKALEAEAHRRYQTVAEMLGELEECLFNDPNRRSRWSLGR